MKKGVLAIVDRSGVRIRRIFSGEGVQGQRHGGEES